MGELNVYLAISWRTSRILKESIHQLLQIMNGSEEGVTVATLNIVDIAAAAESLLQEKKGPWIQ
jgi:hypothetical protein